MTIFYWHEITNELSLIAQTQGLGGGVGRGEEGDGTGVMCGGGVGRGSAVGRGDGGAGTGVM